MNKIVKPSKIVGTVKANASKSFMQRALAAGLLAKGTTRLINPSFCNDGISAISVIEQLGAKVKQLDDQIIVEGGYAPVGKKLNVGESGLGVRLFTPLASLHDKELFVEGEGSLTSRPVTMVEKPLRDLGVICETKGGFIPIKVKGPIMGGRAIVDGTTSSQFLTGLLMALPLAKNDSELHVIDLKSKPYIDMTLQILNDFGIEVLNNNYEVFNIAGNQQYTPRDYVIEGDWSGIAFILVAGAIGGSTKVTLVNNHSKQADMAIIDALKLAGARIDQCENHVRVDKSALNAFEFDATECPDLFPPLVSLAAHCKGTTEIRGAKRLKHKESDRATVLKKEFEKIGVQIEVDGDTMKVIGGTVTSGSIDSNNDHRIAMAGATAAIAAKGEIIIEGYECIAKSYPSFFEDLKSLGGIVYESEED